MKKYRITAAALAAVLTVGMFSMTGCGKKDEGNTSTGNIITGTDYTSDGENGTTHTDVQGVEWPDDEAEKMSPAIDAVVTAFTDYPDLEYDMSDNTTFWTLSYYLADALGESSGLCKVENNKTTISAVFVKVFARVAFNGYTGQGDLPKIPSSLKDKIKKIKGDDGDEYTLDFTGVKLGKSSVYAAAKNDDGTFSTVSYVIGEDSSVTPWKLTLNDARSGGANPVFSYRISAVEKVEKTGGDSNAADETE